MKIAIVGWGIEGQSAFNYFGPDNEYLIVNEEPRNDFPQQSDKVKVQFINSVKPAGVTSNVQDLSYLAGIESYDKIIYAPTARKNLEKMYGNNPDFWNKTSSILQIFFENIKSKDIIGVTGTKGKGTTSSLLVKMLEQASRKVYFGGNIGNGVLDFVNQVQPGEWVVLELSSFQLYKFPYSPHIGVCLMITEEHMDWHADMNEYIEAKSNLFRHQNENDTAIYFPNNEYSTQIASYSPGKKIPYYANPGARVREDGMIVIDDLETEIINKSDIRLIGEHNLENVCAAVTAFWGIAQDTEAIREALRNFTGLEHRLEFVRELDEVKYYNDSFGTTPETAKVAMQAIPQPKVMILGGSDKGNSYYDLIDEIMKASVRHVIAIGVTGPMIADLLKLRGFTKITLGLTNMPDIVNKAQEIAQPGDAVVLSTASASFGMFQDYKDRGNKFKSAVLGLS